MDQVARGEIDIEGAKAPRQQLIEALKRLDYN
jgi:hypothetical protein